MQQSAVPPSRRRRRRRSPASTAVCPVHLCRHGGAGGGAGAGPEPGPQHECGAAGAQEGGGLHVLLRGIHCPGRTIRAAGARMPARMCCALRQHSAVRREFMYQVAHAQREGPSDHSLQARHLGPTKPTPLPLLLPLPPPGRWQPGTPRCRCLPTCGVGCGTCRPPYPTPATSSPQTATTTMWVLGGAGCVQWQNQRVACKARVAAWPAMHAVFAL